MRPGEIFGIYVKDTGLCVYKKHIKSSYTFIKWFLKMSKWYKLSIHKKSCVCPINRKIES